MIVDVDKVVPVEIILPENWLKKPLYRLLDNLYSRHADTLIPIGFVSDGASVMRFMWWLFPPVSKYLLAAIIHDYLLTNGCGWNRANRVFVKTLQTADVHPFVIANFWFFTKMYGYFRHITRGDKL